MNSDTFELRGNKNVERAHVSCELRRVGKVRPENFTELWNWLKKERLGIEVKKNHVVIHFSLASS